MVEQVAQEQAGKVKVLSLDIGNNTATPGKLRVFSIPVLIFFKDGKEVARLSGVVKKDKIDDAIKKIAG